MREHGRLVLAAARRLRLSPADQEDVFQRSWLAAFRAIGSLRDESKFASWLYSIARRQSLDVAQARKQGMGGEDRAGVTLDDLHDPNPGIPDVLERVEEAALLRRTVESMGGRCRDLLFALFLEDPPPRYEHICERLGIPIGSIGPTRARCLRKLQEFLRVVSERESRASILHETSAEGSAASVKEKRRT